MWRIIAVFAALFIGWWLVLWGLLPASWNRLTLGALLIIYLVPPLLAGLGWLAWRGKQAKRDAAAQAAAEKQAEDERQAKRAAAREQHLSDLAQRQQTITCRMVLARATSGRAPAAWLGEEPDFCLWQTIEPRTLLPGGPLESLADEITSLLTQLYDTAPGTGWLPLFLLALPNEAGQTQLNHIGELAAQAMSCISVDAALPTATVRFLPGSGAIAERVQQVLLQEPALPGLIVLAADAPVSQTDPDDEPDAESRARRAWSGEPGAAVVALLFLRDGLTEPLISNQAKTDPADPYQPYWEKDLNRPNGDWGTIPNAYQPALASLPCLARLSMPVGRDTPHPPDIKLNALIQAALDNALVNAALVDYPFSEEERDPAKDQAASIAWLVHNSGDAHVGGTRLAALSNALSNHQTAINPIDQASNLVREWGDTGHSTPALATALAITHCARLSAPVVLSHFESNHLSIGVATPATA